MTAIKTKSVLTKSVLTKKEKTGRYLEGVFPSVRKDGKIYYRASLTYRRKHISLGSFPTEEAAHAAYLEGRRILQDSNCALDNYHSSANLAFEKWVSLLNFKNHGSYFSNPIFMGKKMFYYYLSPTRILKFDLEELSYYASHKIMYRGSHYFVADYGSQISITSRYHIRPYAREGKDYRFLNGDATDFRRENLEILNPYHGITPELKNGQYLYTVRIHIKGNYLVGRYSSITEAAIAYNKAVAILAENGLAKKFPINYVEGLPSGKYMEIYEKLQISPNIYTYKPGSPTD